MESAVRTPISQRINFRIILFVLVVVGMIGVPLFWYIWTVWTGGVVERGEYAEVDLYAMSNFEMDQANATDEQIPEKWRKLDGKRVLLRGEMYTGRSAAGEQSEFNLVYSIQKCCFSGMPKVQHFVKCTPMPGRTIRYYPNLVQATGVLHVGVRKDQGRVLSVYRFEVDSVRPD